MPELLICTGSLSKIILVNREPAAERLSVHDLCADDLVDLMSFRLSKASPQSLDGISRALFSS